MNAITEWFMQQRIKCLGNKVITDFYGIVGESLTFEKGIYNTLIILIN